eukprot:12384205-Alexandrium_andersonii.AAC.1
MVPPGVSVENGLIAVEELRRALGSSKQKRRGGPSGLPVELLKWMDELDQMDLVHFYNECIEQGAFPKAWTRADVVSIFKK